MDVFDNESRTILVTGANGQDGTYLIERLLGKGDEVHGLCHSERGAALLTSSFPRVHAHVSDIVNASEVNEIVSRVRPTHIFNLAGNTSVERSWTYPTETAEVLGSGAVTLLEAAWRVQETAARPVKFLQASSAEIFGGAVEVPQREDTPLDPVTPYGIAKSLAHEMVGTYRLRGMFASSAILYNHESPRRPATFVARKIARQVAKIHLGMSDTLRLGNIDAYRDWGYAPDYVDAMIRIVEAPEAGNYIVATGVAHSVKQFVQTAFAYVGIDEWEKHVVIDPALYRPVDPKRLVGDPSKLRSLGWEPSIDFTKLVHIMVDADLAELKAQIASVDVSQ